ncbi:hypothetical protein ACP4OV_008483 [Aristida adscensionis]
MMEVHQEPEIPKIYHGTAVLRIFALGVRDVQNFEVAAAPDPGAINIAEGKPFVCGFFFFFFGVGGGGGGGGGACYVEICSKCHLEYHTFISCDAYKEYREDQDATLLEWNKGKENVKNCQSCGYTIEKADGCNHVECRCGNHICWGAWRNSGAVMSVKAISEV